MRSLVNRVAFVVEGTYDRIVIDALSRRVWQDRIDTHIVRLGGSAAVPWVWATVLSLLYEKHYAHVILVLDADTLEPQEIDKTRSKIEAQLLDHKIDTADVSIIMVVPELEAWLLADREEEPEQMGARARYVAAYGRDVDVMRDVAMTMDLERAASRASSLREFLATLENVEQRVHASVQQLDRSVS